jgi:DNA primase
MFPVHTVSGKVVAFGGRLLQNNPKAGKYINSPESEIYHKSDHLYGIYFAKQAIIQKDCCIMVEGYLDVISLHQAGIKNVVASSGTSLTIEQIRLVHRFTNNMLLLYDGDKAGIKASLRGIDMLLREGLNIKVALLPDGEDPDSYAQSHSTEEVEQFLKENQVDFITFKTSLLLDEVGNDPIRRATLIGDVIKSIAVIPNDILRSEYTRKCSEMLQAKEQVLVSEIAKLRRRDAEEKLNKQTKTVSDEQESEETDKQQNQLFEDNNSIYNKERAIVQFILRNGEKQLLVPEDSSRGTPSFTESVISNIHYSIDGDGIKLSHPLYKKIFEEAAEHAENPDFVAEKHFLAHPDEEVSRLTAELCNDRYILSKSFSEEDTEERNETAILFEQATRLVISYKQSLVDEMLKETMRKLKEPATMQNAELANEVMQNYKYLKETQQALNNQLKHFGFGECALNI